MFIQSFNSVLLDNQKLILANENKLIAYDIENVKIIESQEINETKELECVIKLSGNRFVVGDNDGKIMVYDFKDGKIKVSNNYKNSLILYTCKPKVKDYFLVVVAEKKA